MDDAMVGRSADEDDETVGEGEGDEDMERLNRIGTCFSWVAVEQERRWRRTAASPEPSQLS